MTAALGLAALVVLASAAPRGGALADARSGTPPPKKLDLIGPADGFVAGREDAVTIVAVDTAGALTAASGMPTVNGPVGSVERIADGLWQVKVTPGASGVVSASLDGATGRLDLKPASPAVITMSVNDAELSPVERGTVIAIIEVKTAAGVPVDDVMPQLAASMGTPGPMKKLAPGRWSAGVKMSDKKYPHAVLLTASLPRREVKPAVATVQLQGKASIPISSEAGAKVTVRVGKRTTGPMVVGSLGVVEAAFDAGPGDQSMEVESVDAAGNRNSSTVPIDMPPYPRLWAQAFGSANGLDGRTRVTVHAAALDGKGLKGGEPPKATIAGATIPLEGGDGAFTGSAVIALPPGTQTLTVSAGGDKLTFPILSTPLPAVGIALDVAPTTLSMGGTPAVVSAYRVDVNGKRVSGGDAPKLAPEGLKMTGLASPGEVANARVAPIEGKIPAATWISARASGPGFLLSTKRDLTVKAGEPALVEILQVEPTRLPADGRSTALLQARVTDKWGNPVGDAKITTKTSSGTVVSTAEPVIGTYHVVIRAPKEPSSGAIGVSAGSATRETLIAFVRPPPKWAIAGGVGGGNNFGALTSFQGWVEARRSLRAIGESPWAAVIRVTGTQGGFAVDTNETGRYDITVRQALAMGGVRWRFTKPFSGWTLAAVASGGGGTVEVAEKNGAGTVVEVGRVVGGRGALMGERHMGRSAAIVELGYSHLNGDEDVITGNLGGLDITVGYRHGF